MINEILSHIPNLMPKRKLFDELYYLSAYDKSICEKTDTERLIALSDIYDIYLPTDMTYEVYVKLYLGLLNSFKTKCLREATNNSTELHNSQNKGVLGGLNSFTIIGESGLGKTTAIYKSIEVITQNRIIEIDEPYQKVVPILVVQCPFDASVKGLLLEILRKTDEILNTRYYETAIRIRATTDMLIGSVSRVSHNHIGLLVVDEIQNVVENKGGKALVGMLTQLINNAGISICMVGTSKCKMFFEKEMQLARRSVGLEYAAMPYDDNFFRLCRTLFEYQYTRKLSEMTDSTVRWLYEHSGGNISVVVSLIHDAQEIAILNGTEQLNINMLNSANDKRLSMLRTYINAPSVHKHYSKKEKVNFKKISTPFGSVPLSELAEKAKKNKADLLYMIKQNYTVSEVSI